MSTHSNTATMAAGVFASEAGQRLLYILMELGERGFRALYDKCLGNVSSNYYQDGLRRVQAWSEGVIFEDIDFVKEKCSDFEETYENCFVQYVADRYRGKRPTVRRPAPVEFVRSFYDALSQQESLVTGAYFSSREPLLKRVSCMDAGRTTFYGLLNAENVRVELMSEANSAAPSRVRSLAEVKVPDLEGEVRPSDSISQINAPQRRPPSEYRAPSRVEEARSEVSRHDPPAERAAREDDGRSHVSARPARADDARSHVSARPARADDARSHVSARPAREDDARSHVSARPAREDDTRSHVSARPAAREDDARSHVSARPAAREDDARSHVSARPAAREDDARSHVSARPAAREDDARSHVSHREERAQPAREDARSHVSHREERSQPAREDRSNVSARAERPAPREDARSHVSARAERPAAREDDSQPAKDARRRDDDARSHVSRHEAKKNDIDEDGFLKLDDAPPLSPPPLSRVSASGRHPYQGSTETHTTVGMARARSPMR